MDELLVGSLSAWFQRYCGPLCGLTADFSVNQDVGHHNGASW